MGNCNCRSDVHKIRCETVGDGKAVSEVPATRPTWRVKFTNSSKHHGVICLESAEYPYEGGGSYPWQRFADPWLYPWTKIDMPPNACVTITQEETPPMRRYPRRGPFKALFYKDDKTGQHRKVWCKDILIHQRDDMYRFKGTSPPIPGPDEEVWPVRGSKCIPNGEDVINGRVVKRWLAVDSGERDRYFVWKKIDPCDRSYDIGYDLDLEAKTLIGPKYRYEKESPSDGPPPRPRPGEHRPQ